MAPDDIVPPPATPHLTWLGATKPHDKVLPAGTARAILARPVVIEELADGAVIALGSDGDTVRATRRQQVLGPGAHPEFNDLWGWIAEREERLARALGRRLVLFGAWCAATRTVRHDALPDWLVVHDVHERATGRFWSVDRRNALCRELDLATAPELARMKTDVPALVERLRTAPSALGSGHPAGLVVRLEQGDHLVERAVVTRAEVADAPDEPSTRKTLARNALATAQ